jgi:hypothetical protein
LPTRVPNRAGIGCKRLASRKPDQSEVAGGRKRRQEPAGARLGRNQLCASGRTGEGSTKRLGCFGVHRPRLSELGEEIWSGYLGQIIRLLVRLCTHNTVHIDSKTSS